MNRKDLGDASFFSRTYTACVGATILAYSSAASKSEPLGVRIFRLLCPKEIVMSPLGSRCNLPFHPLSYVPYALRNSSAMRWHRILGQEHQTSDYMGRYVPNYLAEIVPVENIPGPLMTQTKTQESILSWHLRLRKFVFPRRIQPQS